MRLHMRVYKMRQLRDGRNDYMAHVSSITSCVILFQGVKMKVDVLALPIGNSHDESRRWRKSTSTSSERNCCIQ